MHSPYTKIHMQNIYAYVNLYYYIYDTVHMCVMYNTYTIYIYDLHLLKFCNNQNSLLYYPLLGENKAYV